jgi:hypothetical protein
MTPIGQSRQCSQFVPRLRDFLSLHLIQKQRHFAGGTRQAPLATHLVAVGVEVVTLVAERSLGPAGAARDGRDAVDQGEGLGNVVDVGCRIAGVVVRGAGDRGNQSPPSCRGTPSRTISWPCLTKRACTATGTGGGPCLELHARRGEERGCAPVTRPTSDPDARPATPHDSGMAEPSPAS